jgi:tetratricopeptide (TPR) repeat protein
LLESRLSSRHALRALLKARSGLGAEKGLAAVRIFADGNHVLVREDNRLWEAETGQAHFDFDEAAPARQVARITDRDLVVVREPDTLDSDDWYNLGLDLEDASSPRAMEAYSRAIELNPRNADAFVNMGRLLQLQGDLKRAKRHYERALELVPNHQLALYNLGTLHDERDDLEAAVDCYYRAGDVADAHYNLCRIFEIRGDEVAALRHLRRYRQLVEG